MCNKNHINAQYCITGLKQFMEDHIPKKQPHLVGKWKLHHDNAQPYIMHCVTTFLAKQVSKSYCTWPTVWIWPLVISSFTPTTKKELEGKHFPTGMAAVKASEMILKHIAKGGFQNVFLEWQRC